MYLTDKEAQEFEENFDRLRSYKTGEGKKKWYVAKKN